MTEAVPFAAVPAGLGRALEDKGFTELTQVQNAVLAPELASRDLRITSQTGSGKTVAIGFVLAKALEGISQEPAERANTASPRVLLIAPTRELAQQIGRELSWLYRPLDARVGVVTGGTNLGLDFRLFRDQPHVLVGTPGRLVDHIERGSLDLSKVRAAVLDEADEMLDMGFRDELTAILDATPETRETHMVSATMPREVLRLAKRYQRDAASVQGTRAGAANADITHVAHLVKPQERLAALINLLLAEPDRRTLVFVRTRNATNEIANSLKGLGFSAGALSGEMGQRERNAMLSAFRSNAVRIVVATDVAARGLDIEDVAQVVHLDLPENPDVLTHRSGRTGRAGNKGTSISLVPRNAQPRFEQHARRAGMTINWRPVPTAKSIRAAADKRLVGELVAEMASEGDVGESSVGDERHRQLAKQLLDGAGAAEVVAALLSRLDQAGPCEPRQVQDVAPMAARDRSSRNDRGPSKGRGRGGERHRGSFTTFHVSWGTHGGANPSRLLAMVCRRGDVRGQHIGAIRIGPHRSVVDVASHLAEDFARAAREPDLRNPKIKIRLWTPPNESGKQGRPTKHPRPGRPTGRPTGRNARSAR